MHAVQDSFTHTYRTPDGTRITVVLDWVDSVNGGLKESEDGPAHATSLDACDDPDDLRRTRRVLATEASTALLVATMDPGKTRDESIAAVEQILDAHLGYSPGCTFANGWCQAAEVRYKDTKGLFGCVTAQAADGPGPMAAWVGIALLGAVRRGRQRRCASAMAAVALAVTLASLP